MKNPPAFQLYPNDFLADPNVAVMNLAELGAYFKLICHCWQQDGLDITLAGEMLSSLNGNGNPERVLR